MENKQKVWVVRHGQDGHEEQTALDKNAVSINWFCRVNFSDITNIEELKKKMNTDEWWDTVNKYRKINVTGQVRRWILEVQQGDIVLLPLKTTDNKHIAVGRITGKYEFTDKYGFGASKEKRGCYPVEWLRKDVRREDLGKDLVASLGRQTIVQVQRNNAVERFEAVIETGKDPMQGTNIQNEEQDISTPDTMDQEIIDQIYQRFDGHELCRLVEHILKAEGYTTLCSPPGADGGVDILAGKGLLGFENPKICVQVKRTQDPQGVDELRKLQGTMQSFHAEYGLFVSLGGFKQPALKEARNLYFKIRLWDGDEFIEHLYNNYDKLPPEIQSELPSI